MVINVSIIICAYNEEKTIADVVKSCCEFNPGKEVIVVDDGSEDNTEEIIKELSGTWNFKYEKFHKNKGKSWAMVRGVEISSNDVIIFFDSDVSNIKKEHFDSLLNPILLNTADMVLGPPAETFMDYNLNPFKSFTGQRAMLKSELLPILEDLRDLRFGVETFLNLYFKGNGKRIKYVEMPGLTHPTKFDKTTTFKAAKDLLIESQEIAVTYVKNYDLIIKRLSLLLNFSNGASVKRKSLKDVENEI